MVWRYPCAQEPWLGWRAAGSLAGGSGAVAGGEQGDHLHGVGRKEHRRAKGCDVEQGQPHSQEQGGAERRPCVPAEQHTSLPAGTR